MSHTFHDLAAGKIPQKTIHRDSLRGARTAQQRFERTLAQERALRDHAIKRALADGHSMSEVATATGLTKSRISQVKRGIR